MHVCPPAPAPGRSGQSRRRSLRATATLLLGVACWACGSGSADDGPLLAEVGDQRLSAAAVRDLVPPGTPPADSLARVRAYVEQWVRDAAVADEAAGELDGDAALEALVRDYRASLLRRRYLDRRIADRLDEGVDESELEALYAASGDEVLAPTTVVRAIIVALPPDPPEEDALDDHWEDEPGADDLAWLADYGARYNLLAIVDPDTWYDEATLGALLPGGELSSTRPGRRVARGDSVTYRVCILERVEAGEPAPLEYVRDLLGTAILEERRAGLVAQLKDDIYRAALARDDVKIYLDHEE